MGTRLYVGNLSFDTVESDLNELFSQMGNVVTCDLMSDRYTGKSRGFAFVEMASKAEAEAAITGLSGKTLKDRTIVVNESRPRADNRGGGSYSNRRSGGYGSGGYGGGRSGRSGGSRQRRY